MEILMKDQDVSKKQYRSPALAFYGKVTEITLSGKSGTPEPDANPDKNPCNGNKNLYTNDTSCW